MSKIPYRFLPIPIFLVDKGWTDDQKTWKLLCCLFGRTSAVGRIIYPNGRELYLEPFEFIFGRDAVCKETGLSDSEVKDRMAKFATSKITSKIDSKSTSKYTVHRWMTECFEENWHQQNHQQNHQHNAGKSTSIGTSNAPAEAPQSIRKEEKKKEEDNIYLEAPGAVELGALTRRVFSLDEKTGTFIGITQKDIDGWKKTYEYLNPIDYFDEMAAWLLAKKTPKYWKEIPRKFFTNWLAKHNLTNQINSKKGQKNDRSNDSQRKGTQMQGRFINGKRDDSPLVAGAGFYD